MGLSNGFYHVPFHAIDAHKLGLTLPRLPGKAPIVAILLVLSMGWTESLPPWFSAMTETGTDLANDYLGTMWDPPAHHLEHLATMPPPPTGLGHLVLTEPSYKLLSQVA